MSDFNGPLQLSYHCQVISTQHELPWQIDGYQSLHDGLCVCVCVCVIVSQETGSVDRFEAVYGVVVCILSQVKFHAVSLSLQMCR